MNTHLTVPSTTHRPVLPPPKRSGKSGEPHHHSGGARWLIFLLVLSAWITGCQHPQPAWEDVPGSGISSAGQAGAAQATPASPAMKLTQGDVIQVAFEAETNLNTVAKVELDGFVVLPMVGRIEAAGKTLQELQADLQKRYERFIKINDLTVTLVSTSACVYVTGAVLIPGRVPMNRPLTALEAIMEAGGFDPNRANPKSVVVLRTEAGQRKRYPVNLKAALREGETEPFRLQPFDVIYVPKKAINF